MATKALPRIDRGGLRVVEFYAGIGGFHYALEQTLGDRAHVVAAIDINTTATEFYHYNFPSTPHFNRNICGMTSTWLDALFPDIFVLSPPCQPFTRQGLKGDSSDHRTDSFFHLMELMLKMAHLPKYLMMENVEGFQNSQTRNHFTGILEKLGFVYQEFLLSPVQFGIPNSRLRYYLLAKMLPSNFTLQFAEQPLRDPAPLFPVSDTFIREPQPIVTENEGDGRHAEYTENESDGRLVVPTENESDGRHVEHTENEGDGKLVEHTETEDNSRHMERTDTEGISMQVEVSTHTSTTTPVTHLRPNPLSLYLCAVSDTDLPKYLVPAKVLAKCALALDIVTPRSTQCCCFTKAYAHYSVGTGSVLYEGGPPGFLDEAYRTFLVGRSQGKEKECADCLAPLKLRYFTPREVANLMCFPRTFSFPPSATVQQCYRVLGNSLNIRVVAALMNYLFCGVDDIVE
eukprot:Em0014g133a